MSPHVNLLDYTQLFSNQITSTGRIMRRQQVDSGVFINNVLGLIQVETFIIYLFNDALKQLLDEA